MRFGDRTYRVVLYVVLNMTDVQMLEVICVGVIIWFACVNWGIQDYCREDEDNLPAVMLFSVPVAILITIWMMNMGWIPFW